MKKLLLIPALLSLAACQETKVPDERPAADINGTAADNIIRNGSVRVYAWNGSEGAVLMTTETDDYGYYSNPIQVDDQFIKVCITSGDYTEEASGIEISLEEGDQLCAVTYFESGVNQEIMVTPETNLATAFAECKAAGGSTNLQNIVTDANSRVGTLFGYNVLTTQPADMTSDELAFSGLNDSIRSGLWHASFSRLALEAAQSNGLTTHTKTFSSLTLHRRMYDDVKADCLLDGYTLAENGTTPVALSMGSYRLSEEVYRTNLARELVNFVKSDRNKTAVKAADVIGYATTYSLSTDAIYPSDSTPVAFDQEGPVVSPAVDDGVYISGVFNLTFTASDFSGIDKLEYSINGAAKQGVSTISNVIPINTTQYSDGDIVVSIFATDVVGNTTTVTRTLKIANGAPIVNLSSPSLINYTAYQFEAAISNYAQGIASATVNGVTAAVADGVLTAPVTLAQGDNTLSLSIIDGTGVTHSYEWPVDVDLRAPSVAYDFSGYQAYIKNLVTEAVTLKDMSSSLGSTEALYVTPAIFALDGVAPTDTNLKPANWPVLRASVEDAATVVNPYSTDVNSLDMELVYSDKTNAVTYYQRAVSPVAAGENTVLIPLSEEYLGADWWTRSGDLVLSLIVTDEAGNNTTLNLPLAYSVSAPSIDLSMSASDFLSGSASIDLSGTDLVGIDHVEVSLDGGASAFITDLNNLSYSVDTDSLSDGVHYIDVNVSLDGSNVFTRRYEFSVDNTAPSLNVTSSSLVNAAGYVLAGTATDSGSGIAGVTVNGTSVSAGSFSKSYSLNAGYNDFDIVASDAAGNSSSTTFTVGLDAEAPTFAGTSTPSYGGYEVYYKADSDSVPVLAGLSFTSNLPFYLPDTKLSLNGVALTEAYLRSNQMPYFYVSVDDPNTYGVATSKADLNVSFSFWKGTEQVITDQVLSDSVSDGVYLLPLTTEFLGNDFYDVSASTTLKIVLKVQDAAGNSTTQTHEFEVFVAPTYSASIRNNSGYTHAGAMNNDVTIAYIDVENTGELPMSFTVAETTATITDTAVTELQAYTLYKGTDLGANSSGIYRGTYTYTDNTSPAANYCEPSYPNRCAEVTTTGSVFSAIQALPGSVTKTPSYQTYAYYNDLSKSYHEAYGGFGLKKEKLLDANGNDAPFYFCSGTCPVGQLVGSDFSMICNSYGPVGDIEASNCGYETRYTADGYFLDYLAGTKVSAGTTQQHIKTIRSATVTVQPGETVTIPVVMDFLDVTDSAYSFEGLTLSDVSLNFAARVSGVKTPADTGSLTKSSQTL